MPPGQGRLIMFMTVREAMMLNTQQGGSMEYEGQVAHLPSVKPTRKDLEFLRRRWASGKTEQQKPIKGSLALAGDSSFSADFKAVFGEANVTDIQGLEDYGVLVAIFEALVEEEARRQLYAPANRNLELLLNISEPDFWVQSVLGPRGKLCWRIEPLNKTVCSLVDLNRCVFNISRLDALATLADIVGMSFANITQLSSVPHAAGGSGPSPLNDTVPRLLQLSRHPAAGAYAELVSLNHTKGNSGQAIVAIVQYRYDQSIFCLPATVDRCTLSIGLNKVTAFFMNQHLMDERPFATIILCQDIRTAIRFNEVLSESRTDGEPAVIITGHLFNDLGILPWNYFFGHDVVFAPVPTKQCMAMVKVYRDYVMGAGAKSFKVTTHMLLHSKPSDDLNSPDRPKLTDAEEELVCKAVSLDEVERPSHLAQQILDSTISCDEFVRWGQKVGIFKWPKQAGSPSVQNQGGELKIFDLDSVVAAP